MLIDTHITIAYYALPATGVSSPGASVFSAKAGWLPGGIRGEGRWR